MLRKVISGEKNNVVVQAMTDIEGQEKNKITHIAEAVTQGCVICFWVVGKYCEGDGGQYYAEVREVQDRLTSVKLEEGQLEQTLYWGRKIADTIIDFYMN